VVGRDDDGAVRGQVAGAAHVQPEPGAEQHRGHDPGERGERPRDPVLARVAVWVERHGGNFGPPPPECIRDFPRSLCGLPGMCERAARHSVQP
jgi:hypothetical protein